MSNGASKPVCACIAAGSNLGDRRGTIERAIRTLRRADGVRLIGASELIRTEAVTAPGGGAQPSFLNGAVVVETTLSCRELLELLLWIERDECRDRRPGERWAPRTLDLDLLLYGDEVVDEPGLKVPHPRMHERMFVLLPLAQIAPEARHPVTGKTVRAMMQELQAAESVTMPSPPMEQG